MDVKKPPTASKPRNRKRKKPKPVAVTPVTTEVPVVLQEPKKDEDQEATWQVVPFGHPPALEAVMITPQGEVLVRKEIPEEDQRKLNWFERFISWFQS